MNEDGEKCIKMNSMQCLCLSITNNASHLRQTSRLHNTQRFQPVECSETPNVTAHRTLNLRQARQFPFAFVDLKKLSSLRHDLWFRAVCERLSCSPKRGDCSREISDTPSIESLDILTSISNLDTSATLETSRTTRWVELLCETRTMWGCCYGQTG